MELIRPAGLNELRCIARDDLKLYGSIVSVAEYVGPRGLHETDFYVALKQCIVEHTALAVVVQAADTEHPLLERVESLDLTKHCYIRRKENLRNFLGDNHNEPFLECSTRPQWRVVVQPIHEEGQTEWNRFHMAFVCSHNIADGMSGPQLHTSFLHALQTLKDSPYDGSPTWQPPRDVSLPPPLEQFANLSISWSFLLGPLLNEYLPTAVTSFLGVKATSTTNVWKGASARPHQLPLASLIATRVCKTYLSAEKLKSVLAASKEHNARLTGLLTHLTARSLARSLKSRDQNYTEFIAGITINMRKAMKCGEGQMANYPSSTEATVIVEPSHLSAQNTSMSAEDWKSVATTTKHLEERSGTLADQPVGLLAYLNDFRGWNVKNAKAPAKISFEVSNVGVLDGGAGDWNIQDLVFSQSADASGPPMSVNVASTKGGKLNLAFVWGPGALGVDDEVMFMDEVAGDVVLNLNQIASEYEGR